MKTEPVLSLKGITKYYPGVIALDNVSIDFQAGEVHAIVGENGAGKSTFIKTITGAIQPEKGTIKVHHDEYHFMTAALARKHGIECIYQEFNLIDSLSAAENICYGNRYGKLVNQKAMNKVAEDVFKQFGIDIDPRTLVRDLSSAQKQIIEIAKAITKSPRILILDEPTASLTISEIEILRRIIDQLKSYGATIIYISHRMEEIFQVSDRVSVLRDGKYIITLNTAETNRPELIKYMVGRDLSEKYPVRNSKPGEVALELINLTGNGVENISFKARRGEILGIAGLVGSGRTEIMKVVYGAERKQWGDILVNGRKVNIKSSKDAMELGIGYIPEDRKREGCFLMESISWNIVYNTLRKISRFFVVDREKEKKIAESYSKRLRIKSPSLSQKVMNLSGGNQQKVVVAKALAADTEIIIFDEPTRGIDVGAKHEIYDIMNGLCAEGKCVIMVTSDMEELIGMSDRIVVFEERRLAGELTKDQFSQEAVLELASGPAKHEKTEMGA
ncbi:MAG: sugar ABC transporter ATP-binding protein [Oscillospiraceae bacterium]